MPSSETNSPLMEQNSDAIPDEEDEDEEEDVDFNPFLKEASSPEASSSISSDEDEEIVVDAVEHEQQQQQHQQLQVATPMPESKKRKIDLNVEDAGGKGSDDDDEEEEDAICRRTRARYSLANCSLDELETFLQETDDDEDIQNVDDEQEYNKFLKAVLEGAVNEAEAVQENGNVDDDDDDDSDSDVDFEIELEDMLDSDVDEGVEMKKNERRGRGATRKVRSREDNNGNEKKFLARGNRPLRPLVPLPPLPSSNNWQMLSSAVPLTQPGLINGFTPHQIGQLHCLIHEHAQLLLQVFSLSVLDPSHRKIADETRGLISELLDDRDKRLSWRKTPYPDYCFRAPYLYPSVCDGVRIDSMPAREAMWVPRVRGPVLSILDAAPLSLVRSYMTDVSKAVQEYHKRQIEGPYVDRIEKASLFPNPSSPISPDANDESLKSASPNGPSAVPHQKSKKSLAAVLLENTMKESIAFVPKEIVALAQRFYAFFNEALYPHKPPPPPVANRVCFTDSEDRLLAMGMMEYNTDWGKIQQRYLPCKSKHQIFVRQKNRCSSKAPENPIKAVRRMKTSPLTAEEKAHIFKGLKIFKNDWMAVWHFIVPYRDPSLLPRQWRVALGTQKSYKTDEAKKLKRRLYEKRRKLGKAAVLEDQQAPSDKENNLDTSASEGNKSDNDNVEDEDEAYVHEAFLADWRPGNSRFMSSEVSNSCASDIPPNNCNGRSPSGNYSFLSSCFPQHVPNVSHFTQTRCSASQTMASNLSNPGSLSKSSKRQVSSQPRQVTRRKAAQFVKLAPDLPPVNLPPSVRVISQSAFSTYHSVTSHSNRTSSTGMEVENPVPTAHVTKTGTENLVNSGDKGTSASSHSAANVCSEDLGVLSDKVAAKDNTASTDLQMHPLLLRSPEIRPSETNTTSSNGVQTETPVLTSVQVAKTGDPVLANSGDNEAPRSCHRTATLCLDDSRNHSDQFTTKDNNANKDLQMHPLFLRPPEDRRVPYSPVNSKSSNATTFNFIEENRLHSNFSHFLKPPVTDSTVNRLPRSKSPIKSCIIDFHPLLQRTDDRMFGQHPHSTEPVMTGQHVSIQQATEPVPPRPTEMEEELDLEIHLSSTSRSAKDRMGKRATGYGHNRLSNGLLNFEIIKGANKVNESSLQRSSNWPTFSAASSFNNQGLALGDQVLALSNDSSRFLGDHVSNQSLPEIVMEQEELSDSEEENGEDVEFECEEMDDSDKEEWRMK